MELTRTDAEGIIFDAARVGSITDVVTNEDCLLLFKKQDGSLSDGPPSRSTSAALYVVSPVLAASYTVLDADGKLMCTVTCTEAMPEQVVTTFEWHRGQIIHEMRHVRDLKKLALITRMETAKTMPVVQEVLDRLKAAAETERTKDMVAHAMNNGGYVLV